jgi:hypothetical protein
MLICAEGAGCLIFVLVPTTGAHRRCWRDGIYHTLPAARSATHAERTQFHPRRGDLDPPRFTILVLALKPGRRPGHGSKRVVSP